MQRRRIITVDGLAGAGKTALAQALAQQLGFVHLRTGMLYRAVGYLALKHKVDLHSDDDLAAMIARHKLELILGADGTSRVIVDGEDIGERLHQPEVSEAASLSADKPKVRAALVEAQRTAFPGHGLVAEGRDQGTVIFPGADIKFFIETDVDVRVMRRMSQLYGSGTALTEEQVKLLKKEIEMEIIERDKRDIERRISPTKPAADAVIVDNSSQTLTQVLKNMYDSVASRGLLHS